MSDYMIVIEREKAIYGCAIKHSVELDGISIGILKNGESISAHTTAGPHMLSFIKNGKQEKSVQLMIGQEEYITNLSAQINSRQKIEVSKASNGNVAYNNDENKSIKKTPGIPLPIRIVIAIFGFIFLMSVFWGDSDDNDSTASSSNPPDSQTEELTDDEKAEKLLSDASKNFADGKYMQAIKICNNIVDSYPATEAALNIDSYLSEQYESFQHFSAKDIMKEYDGNIVNADKEYTGKVLVISGVISSIGKTNGGSNLCVLLKSDTYFCGVQLNFNSSQEDAVAALSNGQSIKVIGKCTGKSGKVVLFVDGENVMIEDCYIIG